MTLLQYGVIIGVIIIVVVIIGVIARAKKSKKQVWVEEDIPNLQGKIIIVTGGNSGLGFETVKMLSKKGATVILASRSIERGNFAVDEIKLDYPNVIIDVMKLDLSDFDSIKEFVKTFKASYSKLDVLINNAGIMMVPYGKTKEGLERQSGVNHFGHFSLTMQLLDTIKNTKDSRIVNVASIAHKIGKIDFENLFYEKGGYHKAKAYGRSKLMNLLFTYELQRKLDKGNVDVKVLAAHPGTAHTNLGRHIKDRTFFKMIFPLTTFFGHHQYFGAMPQVRAATDLEIEKGIYYGPSGFMGLQGDPVIVSSNKRSHDTELAQTLWGVSEEITNQTYE